MTTLTLNINADSDGLLQVKKATAELQEVLLASKTSGVVNIAAVGAKEAIAEIDKVKTALASLQGPSGVVSSTAQMASTLSALNTSVAKLNEDVKVHKKDTDELTRTYTGMARAMAVGGERAATMADSVSAAGQAAARAVSAVRMLNEADKEMMAEQKVKVGLVNTLNAEFNKQVKILTAVAAATNDVVIAEKAATQVTAQQAAATMEMTVLSDRLAAEKVKSIALSDANVQSLMREHAALVALNKEKSRKILSVKTDAEQRAFDERTVNQMVLGARSAYIDQMRAEEERLVRGLAKQQEIKRRDEIITQEQRVAGEVNANRRVMESRVAHVRALRALEASAKTTSSLGGASDAATLVASGAYVDAKDRLAKLREEKLRATTATKTFTEAQRDLHSATRGLSGAMGNLWLTYGNLIPLIGSFAVASSVIASIKFGAGFESQMTFIQAISEESAKSIAKVSDQIIQMGRSEGNMYAPAQLAEGMKVLTQAGYDAATAFSMLKDVMALTTNGELSVSEAALTVQKTMNAFELPVSQSAHVVDALSKVSSKSSVDVKQLSVALTTAAQVHKLYNASLDETIAILGVLSQSAQTGSSAGTALVNFFKELDGRTETARATLKRLGVDMYDMAGNFKPVTEVIKELQTATVNMSPKKFKEFMEEMQNSRGIKVMVSLLRDAKGEYQTLLNAAKESEGFAARVTSAMSSTTQGEWKQALASFQSTLIDAFREAEPTVKSLAVALKELSRSEDLKQFIQSLVTGFSQATAFVIKFKDELLALGAGLLATKAIAWVWGLVEALKAARVAQEVFNTAAMKNPYILAGTAILGSAFYAGNKIIESSSYDSSPQKVTDLRAEISQLEQERNKASESWWTNAGKRESTLKGSELEELDKRLASLRKELSSLEGVEGTLAAHASTTKQHVSGGTQLDLDLSKVQGVKDNTHDETEKERAARERLAYASEQAELHRIEVLRKGVASRAKLLESERQQTSEIVAAMYEARLISEETYLQKSRDLQAKAIKDKQKSLSEEIAITEDALRQAEVALASVPEGNTGLRSENKVTDLKERLADLRAELEATNPALKQLQTLFAFQDISRGNMLSDQLQDATVSARRFREDSFNQTVYAGQSAGAVELQERLLDLKRAHEDRVLALEREGRYSVEAGKTEARIYVESVRAAKYAAETKKALQGDWLLGAKQGLADYADSAGNVFNSTAQMVSSAFSEMEDSLVNFVKTGKLDFRSLADSIISDIIRIMVQQQIAQATAALANWGMSSSSGGSSWWGTAANLGGQYVMAAKGEVFSSPGVSAYSNQVLTSPIVFPFAKGIGIAGEAGAEAVLPLKRTASGNLGVEASGAGSGGVVFNNNFTLQSSGSGESDEDAVQFAKKISGLIDKQIKSTILNAKRPGGLLNTDGMRY